MTTTSIQPDYTYTTLRSCPCGFVGSTAVGEQIIEGEVWEQWLCAGCRWMHVEVTDTSMPLLEYIELTAQRLNVLARRLGRVENTDGTNIQHAEIGAHFLANELSELADDIRAEEEARD
jgi:hypothetical protein